MKTPSWLKICPTPTSGFCWTPSTATPPYSSAATRSRAPGGSSIPSLMAGQRDPAAPPMQALRQRLMGTRRRLMKLLEREEHIWRLSCLH